MASHDRSDQEAELDAAERALGTMPAAPGRRIDDWDLRLAPLLHAVPPEQPPAGVFARIVHRIATLDAQEVVERARRSERRARMLAGGFFTLATVLALLLVIREPMRSPAPAPARYMAVVTAEGTGQALVVSLDTQTGLATVEPVGVSAPPGRVLQLWTIEGDAAPRPVGLIGRGPSRVELAAGAGATLAVSAEPPGGSPTGLPTGPVLFTGPVVAVGAPSSP